MTVGRDEFVVMEADPLRRVEVAFEDMRQGRMVILVDDEDRENEGDLTMAAGRVTPEAINFMARHGRGLICLTLSEERVDALALPMMSAHNRSPYNTAFTVSIEARDGVSTGISAHDRAHTISVAIDPSKGPHDLVSPGHVFPLRARDGGVLVRAGQTEGSVDLARLAGLVPAGVICEIMNEDGTMARMPDLERFAAIHRLHIVTIADLVRWRVRYERGVECMLEAPLPVAGLGTFDARVYKTLADGALHMVLIRGDLRGSQPPLVRVHSCCPAGDVFGSLSCDCGSQLDAALSAIARQGRGVLLYMHLKGGPEHAILERLAEHMLPMAVSAPEPELADEPKLRQYGMGAQILLDLGVREMRLLTNNPRKIVGLEGFGLRIVERVPLVIPPQENNRYYLQTKKNKLGHFLDDV